MKIDPVLFQEKPLHLHALVGDMRVLDVWQIDLEGGGDGRDLRDFFALTGKDERLDDLNPVVRFLFWLRGAMGRVFRWDGVSKGISGESLVHQLPDELRESSIQRPGTFAGPVRVVYYLPGEALGEIINATIHALISLSMEPAPDGYRLYLSVYIQHTKWWSKYYMALIEPFRHWLVYPNMISTVKRRWKAAYKSV